MPHKLLLPLLLLFPTSVLAATPDGSTLSLLWGLPFALILLSIATGPLLFSHTWHHHFGKITAFWTLLFLIPFSISYWAPAFLPLSTL